MLSDLYVRIKFNLFIHGLKEISHSLFCSLISALRNCDFSLDTCGWSQSIEDDLDWTRGTGKTETQNAYSGPPGDHTKLDGKKLEHCTNSLTSFYRLFATGKTYLITYEIEKIVHL